jgi:hypothetical protein
MLYHQLHEYLKEKVSYTPSDIALPELGQRVKNHLFQSEAHEVLKHVDKTLNDQLPGVIEAKDGEAARITQSITSVPDHEIKENSSFIYHVLHPGDGDSDRAIVILHGYNERNWSKYLPWASLLAKETGAAILMFPIAFHMNRSPEAWNDTHLMRSVSQLRKKLFPDVISSTLSNAAISVRMAANPARFFWSGLESFYDVNALFKSLREGRIPGIRKDSRVDFFTYSIGTLLAEIVMMTNQDGLFTDTRMGIFCGGPAFNRLSPVSKFILDSEGSVQLYSFLVEHLESHIKRDPGLASYLTGDTHPVGRNCRCLLNYRLDRDYREAKFKDLAKRLYAVALKQDEVVPYYEVINTLQGTARDIDIRVDVEDPPFPYRHEDPFPPTAKNAEAVDNSFRNIFKPFCEFLR